MHIVSERQTEWLLRAAGIDPETQGWKDHGRNSVRRLFLQQKIGECELEVTLTRKVRKVSVIPTCALPVPKKKGKRAMRDRVYVFYESKFSPNGTLLNPGARDYPQEKLKLGETPRQGCIRLVEEEFGITGVEPSDFVKLGKEWVKKRSTNSFAGLASVTKTHYFWWEMPPEFFLELFIEKKRDRSTNIFEAHLAPRRLVDALGI